MEQILVWLRDLPEAVKAVILGVVEGLTEFLPISSTGHLILTGWALGFHDERAKVFDVAIQTGAVLAIVWLYRQRFWLALGLTRPSAEEGEAAPRSPLVLHLFVAFLPAAALGLVFGALIKAHLFAPVPVAAAFIVGGLVILWVERHQARVPQTVRVLTVDEMTLRDALKIGLAQAFALIPGTSRSGATIIGGMLFGFSRQAATEFSFFLAVPTLMAAGAYSLLKAWGSLSLSDLPIFLLGLGAAFVSALVVVKWLIRFVAQHSFIGFAWYRIVFGLVVLGTWQAGLLDWSA
jgi:undecaprenyl-diphosphatase